MKKNKFLDKNAKIVLWVIIITATIIAIINPIVSLFEKWVTPNAVVMIQAILSDPPPAPPIAGSTGSVIVGTTSYQKIESTNLTTAISGMFNFQSGTSTASATSTKVATTVDNINIVAPPLVNTGSIASTPMVMQTLIPRQTQMSDATGAAFDATQLKIADKKNEISLSSIASSVLTNTVTNPTTEITTTSQAAPPVIVLRAAMEFGIPGKTLYFSQPIELKISVDATLNGTKLKVKRSFDNGATWTSEGITQSAYDTCTGGIGSSPASEVTVIDGIVTIYSCRASYFAAYTETFSPSQQPAPVVSSGGGSSGGGGGGGSSFSYVPPPAPVQNIPITPAPIDPPPIPSNIAQSSTTNTTDECAYLKKNQQSTDKIMLKRVELAALRCAKLHKSDACTFLTFNNGTKNTYALSKFALARNACDKIRITDPCGFIKRFTGVSTALIAEIQIAKKECKKAILNFEKSCLYVNKYNTSRNKKIMTNLNAANEICLMYKAQNPCGFSKKFNADQYSRLKSEADDAKQMCASISKNIAIKTTKDQLRAAINSSGDVDQYALQMIDEAVDLSEVSALPHTAEEMESLNFTSASISEKDTQNRKEAWDTADFDQEDKDIFDAPENAQIAFAQTITENTDAPLAPQQTIFETFVEMLSNKILTAILLACIAAIMVFYVIIRTMRA